MKLRKINNMYVSWLYGRWVGGSVLPLNIYGLSFRYQLYLHIFYLYNTLWLNPLAFLILLSLCLCLFCFCASGWRAELSWVELGSICFVYCAAVLPVRVLIKQSDPDQATRPDQISESVSGWKEKSVLLISSGNWTGCAAHTWRTRT